MLITAEGSHEPRVIPFPTGVMSMSWQDVAYDANNFSALSPMVWTVSSASGIVRAYWYSIDSENLMTVGFYLAQTKVSGTATTQLKLKVPAGKTIARHAINRLDTWTDDEEQVESGVIEAVAGSTWINLYNRGYIDGAQLWSVDADCDTWVAGQITFPIQS